MPILYTKTGRVSKKKRSIIGEIGGGKNLANGIIDIATYQSLLEKDTFTGEEHAKDLVRSYGLVIFDECHHAPAPQAAAVLRGITARYLYGFSATPEREDALGKVVYLQFGPIRYKVDPKDQVREQAFDRCMVPRFTRIKIDLGIDQKGRGLSLNQVIDRLDKHPARNRMIVEDVLQSIISGKTPLVITKRKEQAKDIVSALSVEFDSGRTPQPSCKADQQAGAVRVMLLTGEGTPKEKRERLEEVRCIPAGTPFVIVATGSYVGEGFDEPRLDTLFLASPHSAERVVVQYSGRLHRDFAGKEHVVVYDYVDTSVPMLERMYKKRLKIYAKLGYEIKVPGKEEEKFGELIEAGAYVSRIRRDIANAGNSIVIEASYMASGLINALRKDIRYAVNRGVAVEISVKKPRKNDSLQRAEQNIARLRELGCTVALQEDGRWGLAIIDANIVWYGSLPLLASGKEEDCSLRIESREVAADLIGDARWFSG